LGFFFSRDFAAAQSEAGSHPIELTNTDGKTEALLQQAFHHGTGDERVAPAVFHQKGENFPTQFDWVPMSSISQPLFSCALHALKQAIDCRPMHRNSTTHPRFSDRDSLLNLPNQLTYGSLARL